MAVCNRFNTLSKKTGTFLTFSQYAEDLTTWQTKSKYHKLVPSKFVAIDIQKENIQGLKTHITEGMGDKYAGGNNDFFPQYLQVAFENGIAGFKNLKSADEGSWDGSKDWSPEYSKTLFWEMMFGYNLLEDTGNLTSTDTQDSPKIIDIKDIKYVGDINIQSYDVVDGMGYSEIYCHIPNEAKQYEYMFSRGKASPNISKKSGSDGFYEDDDNKNPSLLVGGYPNPFSWIEYNDNTGAVEHRQADMWYHLTSNYEFSWNDPRMTTTEKEDQTSFNINAIVVLYDIWNDGTILAQGVPMGMYITGLIGEMDGDNGVIQNSITKFISNEDIYNSGTSYGLRICSKYVIGGQDTYMTAEVSSEDSNYEELSMVLAQFSKSQKKMDEINKTLTSTDQKYKDLLSIFTNSRTNVPYIKQINGEDYWFVNGKRINSSTIKNNESSSIHTAYKNEELDRYLRNNKLSILTYMSVGGDTKKGYATNKQILDKTLGGQDVTIKWEVYYNNSEIVGGNGLQTHQLHVYNLGTGDSKLENANNSWQNEEEKFVYDVNNVKYDHLFKIACGKDGNTSTAELKVACVYPTIFGYHTYSFTNASTEWDWLNDTAQLKRFLLDTREQSHILNNPVVTIEESPYNLYLIYPAEFGELQSIKDSDGYDYMNDFDKHDIFLSFDKTYDSNGQPIVTIKGAHVEDQNLSEMIPYYLYVEKSDADVENKIIYFK